ncbi:MAG: PQ-loop domain-containing transporter [Hymenobacter sp.]
MNLSPTLISDIGLVAAALSALTFFPQVVHTWRTRSAADLSGPMLGLGASGMILWLVYGVAEHNLPILLGNAVNLFFTVLLIFFKHYFAAPARLRLARGVG